MKIAAMIAGYAFLVTAVIEGALTGWTVSEWALLAASVVLWAYSII